MHRLCASFLAAALVTLAPLAHADDPWLALPSSTLSDAEVAARSARDLALALAERGALTRDDAEAARALEQRHASRPGALSLEEIQRWMDRSRSAVRNLASADYDAARKDLLEAGSLTERAVEELNRQEERAARLFDTCLFMVRAILEGGDVQGAYGQAKECRARSPKGAPSEARHTPEVREVLAAVDADLEKAAKSSLRVESSPSGCVVRLNGFEYGTTPRLISPLSVGEYRIQVECEASATARGRVYRVRVAEGETRLEVDTRFDTTVRSDTGLALAYGDASSENQHRFEDASRLGTLIGSRRVLLVTPLGDGGVRADRLAVADDARVVASVWLPARGNGWDHALLARAASELMAGTSRDLRGESDETADAWQPPGSAITSSDDRTDSTRAQAAASAAVERGYDAKRWVGVALTTLWIGTTAGAFAAHGVRIGRGSDLRGSTATAPMLASLETRWNEVRPIQYALAGTALALGIAGTSLWAEPKRKLPWYSWVSGGVGLFFIGSGVFDLVVGGPCNGEPSEVRSCVQEEEELDRGALLALTGVPMLYVPLYQLARQGSTGGATRNAITLLPTGRGLELRGKF